MPQAQKKTRKSRAQQLVDNPNAPEESRKAAQQALDMAAELKRKAKRRRPEVSIRKVDVETTRRRIMKRRAMEDEILSSGN